MKAILTKYIGPTDTKPSRVKASAAGVKSIITSFGLYDGTEEAHNAAAQMLADKYGWTGQLVSGGLPDGTVAHCFLPRT